MDELQMREDLVIGRKPVLELLRSDAEVECIYLQKGLGGTVSQIAAMARDRGIVLKETASVKLDHLAAHNNHQGVVAQVSSARYSQMEDIYAKAGGEPLFVVLADGIEDPHNLGAIIRSAEAAGAHGVIIPKRRSAGLTMTVSKTSAGAVEHLPIVRVPNLAHAMDALKQKGVWFYTADMDGAHWCTVDFSGGVGLIIGAEGRGVGRLLKESSDFVVSLPMRGKIQSLNASVAAGILMYEIARQRMALPGFSPQNSVK
jgi:rRNA methylase, putative, group 3